MHCITVVTEMIIVGIQQKYVMLHVVFDMEFCHAEIAHLNLSLVSNRISVTGSYCQILTNFLEQTVFMYFKSIKLFTILVM